MNKMSNILLIKRIMQQIVVPIVIINIISFY